MGRLMHLAVREALALGHSYVGAEHYLLGMLREPDAGADVLARLGVGDAEAVRAEVVAAVGPSRAA